MGQVNLYQLSSGELIRLKNARWKARTDLGWLCRNVLGYPDVSERIHGPVIGLLQRFPLPPQHIRGTIDELSPGGKWIYKPWIPMYELENIGRRRLILDPRSWLKCHGVNNLATLEDGTYVSVSTLCPGQKILSVNENLRPVWTRVKGVAYQGIKPTIKLSFRTGRAIEVTPNHPIRLLSGWVPAEEIRIGDRVPFVGNVLPPSAKTNLPWAELLGWFLGDGSMCNATVCNTNPLLIEKIVASAARCGLETRIGYRNGKPDRVRVQGVRPLLRELDLLDRTAGTKFIPDIVFTTTLDSLKDFLYGLYMSDGTLTKTGVFLTTKSAVMAEGIQRLLLRINVLSTIKTYRLKTGGYAGNQYYSVAITSPEQVEKFLAFVPWDKSSSWSSARKVRRSNCNTVPKEWRDRFGKYLFEKGTRPKTLPINKSHRKYDISKSKLAKYAQALNDKHLEYFSTDTLYWDTVVDIGPVIHQPTWDVETESESLSTNDLITHNTTVNAQAHTLQWIINYPDVTIQIIQSNTEKAELILGEIKSHFQKNPIFRELFPEHCPQKRVDDWGTKGQFITEARRIQRRESTVMTGAIDKGSAGLHFDVMKFSDIVEPSNVKTDEQIHSVKKTYYMMENLLVRPDSWIDVEGTRYAYCLTGDTGITMEDWSQKPISKIEVGDTVVGWQLKTTTGTTPRRMMCRSKVIACGSHLAETKKYTFASGRTITCTPDHKFWRGKQWMKNEKNQEYSEIKRLKSVRRLMTPVEKGTNWETGWLSGMYDGEGSFGGNISNGFPSGSITISQTLHNPEIVEELRKSLTNLGVGFTENWYSPSKKDKGKAHWKDRCVFLISAWRDRYKFLRLIYPFRRTKMTESLFGQLQTEEDRIVKVEDAGVQRVYWFQCETGNYLADGVCSKNSDLYGDLLEKKKWLVHVRSCYKRVDPVTKSIQDKFTPETLKWPFAKDADGKYVSWWPERFPYDLLEEKRTDDSFIFSTQQLNDPSGDEKEQAFPVNDEYPKKITRKNFEENVRVAYREIVIDTAEVVSARANYTVLTVITVDSGGRVYVEDIRRGKFMPDQWIDILLSLLKKYSPLRVKIEETSYVRGLRPYLERIQALKEINIPFEFVPTDNQRSKPDKIRDTLQPYYKTGDLRFLEDLTEWPALTKELQQFPFGVTDDILDTLADHFRTRDWFGRERARSTKYQHQQETMDQWVYGELYGNPGLRQETDACSNTGYARTGGM